MLDNFFHGIFFATFLPGRSAGLLLYYNTCTQSGGQHAKCDNLCFSNLQGQFPRSSWDCQRKPAQTEYAYPMQVVSFLRFEPHNPELLTTEPLAERLLIDPASALLLGCIHPGSQGHVVCCDEIRLNVASGRSNICIMAAIKNWPISCCHFWSTETLTLDARCLCPGSVGGSICM